jgi:hypothetical protein
LGYGWTYFKKKSKLICVYDICVAIMLIVVGSFVMYSLQISKALEMQSLKKTLPCRCSSN